MKRGMAMAMIPSPHPNLRSLAYFQLSIIVKGVRNALDDKGEGVGR